jgi:beta-lactamase class A
VNPSLRPPAIALLVGLLLGVGASTAYRGLQCGEYRMVNPDYACGEHQAIRKEPYLAFTNDLRAWIKKQREAGGVSSIAVYFRDLRSGPLFGIDEDEGFVPASLLKLPIVLTFMDAAVDLPDLLSTQVRYSRDGVTHFDMPRQIETSATGLGDGETCTIEDLLRNTIVHSDNLSYYLLLEHMNHVVPGGSARITRTFQELGIVDPRTMADEVVTVRGYASLLRMLYNVSYLDIESSEKVLSWLASSTFTTGIGAGVPEGVVVADKFGERELGADTRQLHDCGIVYFPDNPYLLCVMTRGSDWKRLHEAIAGVSRLVWQEVASRRR